MHVWETILTRTTSMAYPVSLQNVNTKDVNVCVVLGPCQLTSIYVPKLKLGWEQAGWISDTVMVKLPFASAGNGSDAHY